MIIKGIFSFSEPIWECLALDSKKVLKWENMTIYKNADFFAEPNPLKKNVSEKVHPKKLLSKKGGKWS